MIAPAAPTLTPVTDPCPGVEIYFPSLDGDVERITVWRVADGVREAVAGAENAVAAGDFVVTDFHVPLGVVSTYIGEVFDGAGASLLSPSSTVQVDPSTSDEVWFQNVLDPTAAFTVILQAASLSSVERTTNDRQVWVAGLPRPFNQFWGEGALAGIPLEFWSRTLEEEQAYNQITAFPQLLIRSGPRFSTLPRLLYSTVRNPRHRMLTPWEEQGPVVWTMTVDETQPFSKAVVRPLITWDDWQDAFPADENTWDDVMAVYGAGTWTDAVRNPPNA